MTESLWKYLVVGIATDIAVGDSIAAAVAFAPDDDKTFTRGTPLRPIGSNATTSTVRLAVVPLRQSAFDVVTEFNSAGPVYPLLNARGKPDAAVAYAKTKVITIAGERSAIRAQIAEFLLTNGYEVIPQQ